MSSDKMFRLRVLFPVATAFIASGFVYFMRGAIFGGIVSLAVTFVMGIIGISLESPTPDADAGQDEGHAPVERASELTLDDAGLSEAESHRLTIGLAYATLTLTVAAVLLTGYTYAGKWWAVGCAGLGIAVLFPKISLLLVMRGPRISGVNGGIRLSLLPRTIDCPTCSANMLLDERERMAKSCICPGCSSQIDLR